MSVEIERKFLVKDLSWKESATSFKDFQQGYFPTGDGVTVRARIAGDKARGTFYQVMLSPVSAPSPLSSNAAGMCRSAGSLGRSTSSPGGTMG